MATPETVLLALQDLCVPVIYPNGTASPSITGRTVFFIIGEPNPVSLDPELAAGKTCVSFFPWSGERNVTRFDFHAWDTVSISPATITLTVDTNTLTIGGTVAINQACVVIVNGDKANPYFYDVQAGDTLSSIATNIAALIAGASAVGPVITIPTAYSIEANISTQGLAIRELKRQQRLFRICIRSANPDDRNLIADSLDNYLAHLPSIDLTNDYSARMTYRGSPFNDALQKARLFERLLLMEIEYATTELKTFYTIADPYVVLTRDHNLT